MKTFIVEFEDSKVTVQGTKYEYKEDKREFHIDGGIYTDVVRVFEVQDTINLYDIFDELLEAKDQIIKMLVEKGGIDKATHEREEQALERYIKVRYDRNTSRS